MDINEIPKYRNNNLHNIHRILKENKIPEPVRNSVRLERSIYNYCIRKIYNSNFIDADNINEQMIRTFLSIYEGRTQTILANIDSKSEVSSTYLSQKIRNNEINIKKLPEYNIFELNPIHNKEYYDYIEKRNNLVENFEKYSDHICKNCKQQKVIIKSYQSRGADESETISAFCANCKSKWIIQ